MLHTLFKRFTLAVGVTGLTLGLVMPAVTSAAADETLPPAFIRTEWAVGGVLDNPRSIARDTEGNLYVVDTANNRVRKFDASGTPILEWGSSGSANGQFDDPHGIAVDSVGNVYVSDIYNHRVQKFTANGVYISQWGTGSPSSSDGEFSYPGGITVDALGNFYVADSGAHRIQKFDSNGTFVTQWGGYGNWPGEFIGPQNITTDSAGNVYVADTGNNRIEKFDSAGTFITQWGSTGSGDGQFQGPQGLAIDESGYLYVADTGNNRIQKFSTGGDYVTEWGVSGTGDGEFAGPRGLMADSTGLIHVVDSSNNRVQVFGYDQSSESVNAVTGAAVELTTPAGTEVTCEANVTESSLAGQDDAYAYPLGMLDFCFTTSQTSNSVAIVFVTDLEPGAVVARKYNPATESFATVESAVITQTTYQGDPAIRISYDLEDNGVLDTNSAVGVIDDPIGLAVADTTNGGGNGGSTPVANPTLGAPNAGVGGSADAYLAMIAFAAALLVVAYLKVRRPLG